MRICFDTEFIEDGKTIDLISIGMVREDGKELYLVSNEFDETKADAWVVENVLKYVNKSDGVSRAEMRQAILDFVGGETPEFWACYADYDWVVLCQLFGRMIDLPKGWPMFCMDIKQLAVMFPYAEIPKQEGDEHHALADARWNAAVLEKLTTQYAVSEE